MSSADAGTLIIGLLLIIVLFAGVIPLAKLLTNWFVDRM